jgi:hypothetical protein
MAGGPTQRLRPTPPRINQSRKSPHLVSSDMGRRTRCSRRGRWRYRSEQPHRRPAFRSPVRWRCARAPPLPFDRRLHHRAGMAGSAGPAASRLVVLAASQPHPVMLEIVAA